MMAWAASALPFSCATSARSCLDSFLASISAPASIRSPIIGGLLLRGGDHQRGHAGLRLGINVGAPLDQLLSDIVGPRAVGRKIAPSAGAIWLRAIINGVSPSGPAGDLRRHRHRARPSPPRICFRRRRPKRPKIAFGIRLFDIGAVFEQHFDRGNMVAHHGVAASGVMPLLSTAIDVGLVGDQSSLTSSSWRWRAAMCSGCEALIIQRVDVGALADQEFDALGIVGVDGVGELLIQIGAGGEPAFQLFPWSRPGRAKRGRAAL